MNTSWIVSVGLVAVLLAYPLLDKRFESPKSLGVTPRADVAWWKRTLIQWNEHVRISGLFVLWIGLSCYLVKARRAPEEDGAVFVVVAGLGVLLLLCGLLWRRFVTLKEKVAS